MTLEQSSVDAMDRRVRQFLSILLSCIIFANPLTFGQWGGTGIIFGSLYYKVRPAPLTSFHANDRSKRA